MSSYVVRVLNLCATDEACHSKHPEHNTLNCSLRLCANWVELDDLHTVVDDLLIYIVYQDLGKASNKNSLVLQPSPRKSQHSRPRTSLRIPDKLQLPTYVCRLLHCVTYDVA